MSTLSSSSRRKFLQTLPLASIGMTLCKNTAASEEPPMASGRGQGFVNTEFGAIYYRQCGIGPSLLMVHQSAQSSQEYSAILPYLLKDFRVTTIDLPGHGQSDTPPRELEMQEYTDSICAALQHLGISKTHVVGNHGGAALAVDLATRFPELVDGLVLCGLGRGEELDIEALKSTPMTRDLPIDAEGDFLAKTWQVYRRMSARTTPPDITYQPFLVSLQQRLRPYDMHHAAYRWDYYDVIHELDKPTLFLKAEEDSFAGDTAGLAAKVKGSHVQTIAGGGVWVFYEQPERCADAIRKFCKA